MTDTICGHDRDVLRWALKHYDTQIVYERRNRSAEAAALSALDDPAKLAAIMAEVLRERGSNVYGDDEDPGDDLRLPCTVLVVEVDAIEVYGYLQWRSLRTDHADIRSTLTIPEARAVVLQWLNTPDGAPLADVLKALEATHLGRYYRRRRNDDCRENEAPMNHGPTHDEQDPPSWLPLREYHEPRRFDSDPDREREDVCLEK